MQLSLTSNAPQYRAALIDFMAAFRLNVQQVLRYQGRLFGQRLVQFTPPRNQAQGKRAVRRDIGKLFLGLENSQPFTHPVPVVAGDNSFLKVFTIPTIGVFGVAKDLLKETPSPKELGEFHRRFRNRRGQVRGTPLKESDMGTWTQIRKMVIPQTVLAEYIRDAESRVGEAKGGWAPGVLKLGGKIPGWIAAHAAAGTFIDGSTAPDPFLEFINKSQWALGGDQDRIIDNTIRARTRDIKAAILRARRDASKKLFA